MTGKVFKKQYRKRAPKSWYQKKYSVGEMASKALKGVMAVKRLINVEKHLLDFQGSSSVGGTWSNIYHITQIGEGDGVDKRAGISVKPQALFGNIRIVMSPSATTTVFRFVVVKDLQCIEDASTLDVSKVFERNEPTSLKNNLHEKRFQILCDRTVILSISGDQQKIVRFYCKLHGHVLYNGAGVNDIEKNGMYMLAISNEATNTPTMVTDFRLTYTDN